MVSIPCLTNLCKPCQMHDGRICIIVCMSSVQRDGEHASDLLVVLCCELCHVLLCKQICSPVPTPSQTQIFRHALKTLYNVQLDHRI